MQIYCDFSGYTDIAIGLALLMGFVFPQNFDRPYRVAQRARVLAALAHDPVALPARLPLHPARRQPRRARPRPIRNLMITMLLGGLWHGAAWGFVLWGALHGAALVVRARRARPRPRLPAVVAWAATFLFVCLAWIPFRAPDLDTAWAFAKRLVTPGPSTLLSPGVVAAVLGVLAAAAAARTPPGRRCANACRRSTPSRSAPALAVVVALVAASVPGNAVPPFIYFQF